MEEADQVTHLWLIRHAPVAGGKIIGHTDAPADFSDAAQISRLANLLPKKGAFLSSDLRRSSETALKLLDKDGRSNEELSCRPALREQDFGSWENRTYSEVEQSDPESYFKFWRDPASNSPPNGESFEQVQTRVQAEIDELLTDPPSQNLILVIHAGPIRALLGSALGLTAAASLAFQVDPLSLTRLTLYRGLMGRSWQIGGVNLKA
ncbi:MAG: histidine phosphatase family protein [Proteobacteria bacterium]|nr:histidine phosphatase family protein [Pseudomonadota bacterium]